MTYVENVNLQQRFETKSRIWTFLRQRFGIQYVEAFLGQRFATQSRVDATFEQRFKTLPPGYVTAIQTPAPYQYGLELTAEDTAAAVSLELAGSTGNYVQSFTYRVQKNQAVSWTVELLDADGTLLPNNTGSAWAGLLDVNTFSGDQSIVKRLLPILTIGATSIALNDLVILNRQYDLTADGFRVRLSGTDVLGRLLSYRNRNRDSFVSTSSHLYTAKEILNTVLPDVAVTQTVLQFDDYPVRTFHVQNERPMDLLNQLLWVPRAYWFTEGNVLFARQWQVNHTPNWTYQDVPGLIFSIGEAVQAADLINQVKVNLHVPAGSAPVSLIMNDWGIGTVNFPNGLYRPTTQIEQQVNGQVRAIDYYDQNGNWVGHFPTEANVSAGGVGTAGTGLTGLLVADFSEINGRIKGTGVVFSATVLWTPPDTTAFIFQSKQSTQNHLKINFRGSDPNQLNLDNILPPIPNGLAFPAALLPPNISGNVVQSGDPTTQDVQQRWGVIVQDSASIAAYGLLEAEHPVENALIPNLPWAWRVGVNTLKESGRLKTTYTVRVPLNPLLQVGDTVNLVDGVNFVDLVGLVESVEHHLTRDDAMTTFGLVVYE